MKLHLHEKPQGVTLVLGFPGFGLVGTIATKFLLEHLDVKRIGEIESNKLLPLAAIHKNELIGPLDLFYNKKYNIVILQTLSELSGSEWQVGEVIEKLAKLLKAKEVIILEGLPSNKSKAAMQTFLYSRNNSKMAKSLGLVTLKEGIMMGVTAAVMLKLEDIPSCAILAESPSKFPDSEAAARAIKTLDQYLKMGLDYKPLMKSAQNFEVMLKEVMSKAKEQNGTVRREVNPDADYIG